MKHTLLFLTIIYSIRLQAQWVPVGDGMDNYVWGSAVYNGKLYACGNFEHADADECLAIAKWDGSAWSNVGGGFQHGAFSNVVRGLIVFDDMLYAGGYVDSVGGVSIHKVAKWDGTSWSAVGSDCPISTVNCFAIHNGELYAGGQGSGAVRVCVAKWNGTNWISLDNEGVNTDVWALASYNGKLYAGGSFSTFNGLPIGGVAQWDGSAWSDIGSGFSAFDIVHALSVFNNKLYIGGAFTAAGGIAANNIVSWDGSSWEPLSGGVNAGVQSLLAYGNKLFVGGIFWEVNSVSANRSAYWDGSAWTVLGTDLGSGAKTISIYNGSLYYGGEGAFNNQHYFAKWSGGTFTGIDAASIITGADVFPNPAAHVVNIQMSDFDFLKDISLIFTDVSGKMVAQFPVTAASSTIDLRAIDAGFYLYQIQENKKIISSGKLVIE